MYNKELIEYIKSNTHLIRNKDIDTLYENYPPIARASLTQFFYDAEINPLKYLTSIPECFAIGVDTLPLWLELEDRITSIRDFAFAGARYIACIWLTDNVISIGKSAFEGTKSLKDIYIPSQLKVIPKTMCRDSGIQTIKWGKNCAVTNIEDRAFAYCEHLTEVTLPDNLIEIGYYAFGGCSNIIRAYLPASLEYIQDRAFDNCVNLSRITFDGTMEDWYKIDKHSDAFRNCRKDLRIKCKDGVL